MNRFAPENRWYIDTMTKVLRLSGQYVQTFVGHSLMQLVAEGAGNEDEVEDIEEEEEEKKETVKKAKKETVKKAKKETVKKAKKEKNSWFKTNINS